MMFLQIERNCGLFLLYYGKSNFAIFQNANTSKSLKPLKTLGYRLRRKRKKHNKNTQLVFSQPIFFTGCHVASGFQGAGCSIRHFGGNVKKATATAVLFNLNKKDDIFYANRSSNSRCCSKSNP